MNTTLKRLAALDTTTPLYCVTSKAALDKHPHLSTSAVAFAVATAAQNVNTFSLVDEGRLVVLTVCPDVAPLGKLLELLRREAAAAVAILKSYKAAEVQFVATDLSEVQASASIEGFVLTNYEFVKYVTQNQDKKTTPIKTLHILEASLSQAAFDETYKLLEAVCLSRTLVNEPLSYLTATKLSEEIQAAGKHFGFDVTVYDKAKIEELKMGGVLSVNLGSFTPPTFSILEHKPKNATNKQPIVLVGKGVVYDTGGLSLKPTANSMDFMKSDMGGAAVVIGILSAAAANDLPVHIIGLVPSTDNRPGNNAYVPGDVITMHSGHTVEVMNTDAEGRLLLADALSYAKKYNPELVFDFATLTGAAVRAIGPHGIALMSTADRKQTQAVTESGFETYERVVEFPLWEEYDKMLKSDIADLQNLGGATAGAITAGKFLEHFTDYPWMHFDIAPVAYFHAPDAYKVKYGTGTGVRLIYHFLKNYTPVA